MTSVLAFSTATTGERFVAEQYVEQAEPSFFGDEHEPHCFVCNRHTDHFGEHDDLVDLGLAENRPNGDVYPTSAFATPVGEMQRGLLNLAWSQQSNDWRRGHVSLIKPVGFVRTHTMLMGW